ncbi:MAG: hypothetical protein ABGZ23_16050 [Fuerstiella sp.]
MSPQTGKTRTINGINRRISLKHAAAAGTLIVRGIAVAGAITV